MPSRSADHERYRLSERAAEPQHGRVNLGGIYGDGVRAGFSVMAGTPDSIRPYLVDYASFAASLRNRTCRQQSQRW